jgi:hypothetical protein
VGLLPSFVTVKQSLKRFLSLEERGEGRKREGERGEKEKGGGGG